MHLKSFLNYILLVISMVQEQFKPNQQLINKKSKNWPLIIFISVIVGIIVIALIAWAVLYSKGEVGLIGTSSNVDIYCKDCSGESKQECQNLCETEFAKVDAPMLGASMRKQKFGDKEFVVCNCQGRMEDFKKILSGVETNWGEMMKLASEEGEKIQEGWKQEQVEKRESESIGIGDCNKYYDQPYDGMKSLPEFLQYQYPYCVLKNLFDYGENGIGEKHLPLCDNSYVYSNTKDICKYMIAYYLKDSSICESVSFGYSGSKEKCIDILNNCPSNDRNCIITLAIISGSNNQCDRIIDVDDIDTMKNRNKLDCFGESNTFSGDEEDCEKLEEELLTYNQKYEVNLKPDYCWMNVARVKMDESYCNNVTPGKNSRDCHTLVAVEKEDKNVCNSIEEDETASSYSNPQSICYNNYDKIIL